MTFIMLKYSKQNKASRDSNTKKANQFMIQINGNIKNFLEKDNSIS